MEKHSYYLVNPGAATPAKEYGTSRVVCFNARNEFVRGFSHSNSAAELPRPLTGDILTRKYTADWLIISVTQSDLVATRILRGVPLIGFTMSP